MTRRALLSLLSCLPIARQVRLEAAPPPPLKRLGVVLGEYVLSGPEYDWAPLSATLQLNRHA